MAAMPNRRRLLVTVFVPLLIGSSALLNLSRNPHFTVLRNVDVLTLLASGMCFGVALLALLTFVWGRSLEGASR